MLQLRSIFIARVAWFFNSKTYITDHLNCLQLDGCDETTNINMRDAMLMRWSERESDVKLAYNNKPFKIW